VRGGDLNGQSVLGYLREEPLPPWPADFPMRQWAQAWTVAGGKYKSDPKDEAAKSARASFDALGNARRPIPKLAAGRVRGAR
jgi:hypothetical protein